jgi:hypothetical protein
MRLTAGGVRELHWHKSFIADVKKKICGISPVGFHIRFKASIRTARNSCWYSTMEIFPSQRRSC